MRSPLEAISGDYEHAIFTTYSISLAFFERWVLPLLAESAVRNVVVFADAGQLGEALLDPSAQRVGTAYHVVPISLGPGAFHAKLMLLTGKGSQRLVISSANLTVSGQLRNVEVAAVLDSTVEHHRAAISQAGDFVRNIAERAPSHVVEALTPALALIESSDVGTAEIEFVHNLTTPIGPRLPSGDLTATVPYADADGRTLAEISRQRAVRCIVDGEHFESGDGFFEAHPSIEARAWTLDEKRHRVLHAKAYWNESQALVGSPNLSEAALRRTAATGNVEAALLFSTQDALADPGGASWDGDLRRAATHRARRVDRHAVEGRPAAFQAWEEGGHIRIEGLPDGANIDRYTGVGWQPFGQVAGGVVVSDEESLRPRLLRWSDGAVERVAAVHRVVELRIRRARRLSGRSSEVVHTLPLDLEGVRLLEDVLSEFFTLSSLARGDDRLPRPGAPSTPDVDEELPLAEWRPAHPGDEPRIPDIYRRAWSKDPDALLALVQAALRMDPIAAFDQISEFDLATEDIGLDDVDGVDENEGVDDDSHPSTPVTTETVLRRYRQSFRKLLDRGVDFIKSTRGSVLGDLGFQTLMQQCERLLVTVEVDGRIEHLVDPGDVRRFRLRALIAYLDEGDDLDSVCAATARYHLADLIRAEHEWEPVEWERVEGLAYRHAVALLEAAAGSAGPEVLGMTGAAASAWLEDYAARADWLGVVEHVSGILRDVDFALDPYPMIVGTGRVEPFAASPAWQCLGYGMVVGTFDDDPYGIAVRASGEGPYDLHALVFVPAEGVLREAIRRRADGAWMSRAYRPIGRGDLENAGRFGPLALSDAARAPLTTKGLDSLHDLVGQLTRMAELQIVDGGS